MIKIKRDEFIKFLKHINETRSSHSRRIDDIVGDEDSTPVDASEQIAALQLTTSLPDVGDEDFLPGSNKQLRDAMIAIAGKVPQSQIDNFYKKTMALFEKTIDGMPEEENPFNTLAESLMYLFEEDDKNEEEDDDNGEDLTEPEMDKKLSDISKMETGNIDQEDIEAGIESSEYGYDPIGEIELALQNLMLTIQKAILQKKNDLFARAFQKGEKAMASSILADKEQVMNMLDLPRFFAQYLHKIAVATSYPIGDITKTKVEELLEEGLLDFIDPYYGAKERALQTIERAKRKNPNFILDDLKPTMPDELSDEQREELFLTRAEYDASRRYTQTFSGGSQEDLQKAEAYLYGVFAKYAFYNSENKKNKAKIDKELRSSSEPDSSSQIQPSRPKRRRVDTRNRYSGDMLQIDAKSNISSDIIRQVVINYVDSLPDKADRNNFQLKMQEIITDNDGNITDEHSLDLAKRIQALGVQSLDPYQTWIYTSTYYQLLEMLRYLGMQIGTRFGVTDKPVYDPNQNISNSEIQTNAAVETTPIQWDLLDQSDIDIVNSRLEGIDFEIVDTVHAYVMEMAKKTQVISVMMKSSKEAGGNITIDIPAVTFAYLAPFILSNAWQKTLAKHYQQYKPRGTSAGFKEDEIKKIITKLEGKTAQLKAISNFIGFTSPSKAKKFVDLHLNRRYAFLKRAYLDGDNPGGVSYLKAMDRIYDSVTMAVRDIIESYIEAITKILNQDPPPPDFDTEEREYWLNTLNEYTKHKEDIDEIASILEDYDIMDPEIEDAESDAGDNLSDALDRKLRDTTIGVALREMVNDLFIEYSGKESFMVNNVTGKALNIDGTMQEIVKHLISDTPEFKTPNGDKNQVMFGANKDPLKQITRGNLAAKRFVEYFTGTKTSLDFTSLLGKEVTEKRAKEKAAKVPPAERTPRKPNLTWEELTEKEKLEVAGNFIRHGITERVHDAIYRKVILTYDIIFQIAFGTDKDLSKMSVPLLAKGISGSNDPTLVQKYEEMLYPILDSVDTEGGSISGLAEERVSKIESALTNRDTFADFIDFLDSHMLIAELNIEIEKYYKAYSAIPSLYFKRAGGKSNLSKKEIKDIEKKINAKRKEISDYAIELNKEIIKIEKQRIRFFEDKDQQENN